MNERDFETIYNPDGTCNFWYCGAPGVVLAYDDFCPEIAQWFCEECWQPYADSPFLKVARDRRKEQAL